MSYSATPKPIRGSSLQANVATVRLVAFGRRPPRPPRQRRRALLPSQTNWWTPPKGGRRRPPGGTASCQTSGNRRGASGCRPPLRGRPAAPPCLPTPPPNGSTGQGRRRRPQRHARPRGACAALRARPEARPCRQTSRARCPAAARPSTSRSASAGLTTGGPGPWWNARPWRRLVDCDIGSDYRAVLRHVAPRRACFEAP